MFLYFYTFCMKQLVYNVTTFIYKEHTEVKKKRILRYSFNHYLKIELTFIYF